MAELFKLGRNICSQENENKLKEIENTYWQECREAGQIRTDFDNQFWVLGKEGPTAASFLASKWHFNMRQMYCAIREARRILCDIKEMEKKIWDLRFNPFSRALCWFGWKYRDIEIERLQNLLEEAKYNLVDQYQKIRQYNENHDTLLRLNDNKPFTNAEFQAEQSQYYTWFFSNELLTHILANSIGLPGAVGLIREMRLSMQASIGKLPPIQNFLNIKEGKIDIQSIINAALGEPISKPIPLNGNFKLVE